MSQGAYADQEKLIFTSLAQRRKRKKCFRPPDYLSLKQRISSSNQTLSSHSRPYRLSYNPSHSLHPHILHSIPSMF